jgi:hypothetical protein
LLHTPGGGGGGGYGGGGGGAGGVIHKTNYPVTPGTTYTIVVGKGGSGGVEGAIPGSNGDDSVFSGKADLRAYGGGKGLTKGSGFLSSSGGSGGGMTGGAVADTGVSVGSSAVIDPQQGFVGGQGFQVMIPLPSGPGYSGAPAGGGGGGAGGPGYNAMGPSAGQGECPSNGGVGGPGVSHTITGAAVIYAAGGGGGGCRGGAAGTGGSGAGASGGGGAGRIDSGDGGGGSYYGRAGDGGPGIVIIRY